MQNIQDGGGVVQNKVSLQDLLKMNLHSNSRPTASQIFLKRGKYTIFDNFSKKLFGGAGV